VSFFTSISLYHFKNYQQQQWSFDKRIVCIYGSNGSGKTTILDALHFLSVTKSYFHHADSWCITRGLQGMRIQGSLYQKDQQFALTCILRENGKKEFLVNENPYEKLSAHIGRFPSVMIAPDDTELITEGSEIRRRFLDTMISQVNSDYLNCLIQYTRFLQQRNALLKQWQMHPEKDFSLLSVYSKQLDFWGSRIYTIRKQFCEEYIPQVIRLYRFLSDDHEPVDIQYTSQLHERKLLDLLDEYIDKDIIMQRTNYGIHKDDLLFNVHNMPFKQVASQGQRKSFLFSLKLAQYELYRKTTAHSPVLLLDDIFEKLDEIRSKKLIQYLLQTDCQVFITDTHQDRLRQAFHDFDEVQYIETGKTSAQLNEHAPVKE
jgi:DNA replication and repair protein RecF